MGLKAGLLGVARSKQGPCVALHCCWPSVAAVATKKHSVFSYYLEKWFFLTYVHKASEQEKRGVHAELIFAATDTF